MKKSKYYKEAEDEKEEDLLVFVDPEIRKMI
jgi:hypothetical protein